MPPTPVTAYDTCRRMFLGHLPPTCTRNDIMTLIKTRTRATPLHVDIALAKRGSAPGPAAAAAAAASSNNNNKDKDSPPPPARKPNLDSDDSDADDDGGKKKKGGGNNQPAKEKKPLRPCRGFAHVTVEGLKGVVESLAGATIQGQPIVAKQAKPHFLWRLEKSKRDREKEEEKKKEELAALQEKPGYGELDVKTKPLLRPFDAGKARFGNIASEIAAKLRKQAKERKERQKQYEQQQYGGYYPPHATSYAGRRRDREHEGAGAGSAPVQPPNSAAAATRPKSAPAGKRFVPGGKQQARPATPAPAPPPPEPTKQDRKLSALEARLAALQAKLKK